MIIRHPQIRNPSASNTARNAVVKSGSRSWITNLSVSMRLPGSMAQIAGLLRRPRSGGVRGQSGQM
jgi:hypothetical protein